MLISPTELQLLVTKSILLSFLELLYFTMYNVHVCPNFWEENKDVHYTWVVLILYLHKCFKFFYVTLESTNDIRAKNNNLEYDNLEYVFVSKNNWLNLKIKTKDYFPEIFS